MYQKVKRIIIWTFIVSLIVGALLYYVPWPTRVNLCLDAAKVDQSGNVIGHSTITIKGVMLHYLFQEDCLSATIYPFDGYPWINMSESHPRNQTGELKPHFGDCKKIYCSSYDDGIVWCDFLLTMDYKYVAFVFSKDETRTYYLASAENQVSTEELIEYFRYLPPLG